MTTKESEIIAKERAETIKRLEEKRDEYHQRLDIGAEKIEEANLQGKDTTTWQNYWIQLLRQYEAVVDKIRDLKSLEA